MSHIHHLQQALAVSIRSNGMWLHVCIQETLTTSNKWHILSVSALCIKEKVSRLYADNI